MTLAYVSWKNIWRKPLHSLLSLILFAFGSGIIIMILVTSNYLRKEISTNASGIDLVIGAKGSPLQLILANIFHVDFPTGNIPLKDAAQVSRNRLIKQAIPLSLGDSYNGFRVVGTTNDYMDLYGAEFETGIWTGRAMEAVLGSEASKRLGLQVGDEFIGAHGMAEGGADHDEHPFRVSGILKPTGKVIDQLILVSISSVWQVHDHEHIDSFDSLHIPWMNLSIHRPHLEEKQITSLLIKYASPMGAVMLPRQINEKSNLQAASPAFETARLFSILGPGVAAMEALGLSIMILSALSVFIALLSSLKERKYELAVMRAMGASRWQLVLTILLEGFLLTLMGTALGWIIGHMGFLGLMQFTDGLNPSLVYFVKGEVNILLASLVIGVVASVIPAIMAYRSEISKTLAER